MNHEEELIKAFFVPTKRERYLEMVGNPKKRQKLLRELYHFRDLDPRYSFSLPKGVHAPEEIAAFLHKKGAPRSCWVTLDKHQNQWEGDATLGSSTEYLGLRRWHLPLVCPGEISVL